MPLIGRHGEDQLHHAEKLAIALRPEEDAPPGLKLGPHVPRPEARRGLVGERGHEADGRSGLHAVGEDARQRPQPFVERRGVEFANPQIHEKAPQVMARR